VLPWALALLLIVGAASWFMVAYAQRLGVTGFEDVRVVRPRTLLTVALVAATAAGALVRGGVSWSGAEVAGVVGLTIAVAAGAVAAFLRRRSAADETAG